jgi:hypothetical protein
MLVPAACTVAPSRQGAPPYASPPPPPGGGRGRQMGAHEGAGATSQPGCALALLAGTPPYQGGSRAGRDGPPARRSGAYLPSPRGCRRSEPPGCPRTPRRHPPVPRGVPCGSRWAASAAIGRVPPLTEGAGAASHLGALELLAGTPPYQGGFRAGRDGPPVRRSGAYLPSYLVDPARIICLSRSLSHACLRFSKLDLESANGSVYLLSPTAPNTGGYPR